MTRTLPALLLMLVAALVLAAGCGDDDGDNGGGEDADAPAASGDAAGQADAPGDDGGGGDGDAPGTAGGDGGGEGRDGGAPAPEGPADGTAAPQAEAAAAEAWSFPLAAMGRGGEIGTVIGEDSPDGLVVTVQAFEAGTLHAASVRTGTCDAIGDVEHDLAAVRDGLGESIVEDASTASLFAAPHVAVLHEEGGSPGAVIACAPLTRAAGTQFGTGDENVVGGQAPATGAG